MAKHGYVPYKSRQKRNKNMRLIVISLLSCVAIYFVVRLLWGSSSDQPDLVPQETVAVNKVESKPRAEINFRPQNVTPKPVVAKPVVKEPVKPAQPAATPIPQPQVETKPVEPIAKVQNIAQDQSGISPEDITLNNEARKLVEEANKDITNDKIIAARAKLNTALRMPLTETQRDNIKAKMAALSDIWLFSNKILPGDDLCSSYKVQSGDLLSKIAKKNNVTWELLLKMNKIGRPEYLRAGQKIKIVNGPFHTIVDRSKFTMDIYLQQTYVKTYRVGLGQTQYTTPTGMWLAKKGGKMISPSWTDPDSNKTYDATDPDYPLGKRWVGLDGLSGDAKGRTGFAIHGTNEPETIGTRSSRGCIRMLNKDVIEVYDLMMPGMSQIQVKD